MRQSEASMRQSETSIRQTGTAVRQTETPVRQAETSARQIETTARQAETTGRARPCCPTATGARPSPWHTKRVSEGQGLLRPASGDVVMKRTRKRDGAGPDLH